MRAGGDQRDKKDKKDAEDKKDGKDAKDECDAKDTGFFFRRPTVAGSAAGQGLRAVGGKLLWVKN